jgi:anti-sigma factor RsiW
VTEVHESTGSYVLDALDAAERTEFEAHLATCPACADEVAVLSETAAELALLSLATPPPTVRTAILDAVRPARSNDPALRTTAGFPEPGPRADRLPLSPQRRRTRVLGGLVAALVALAVGLGGVVYTLVQERQASLARISSEEQLYAAPDARTTTARLPGGGQVTFVASKELNRALFIGTDLPDPDPNRYQLWTATGPSLADLTGVVRDEQVADPSPAVKVFFRGDIAASDFLAVNLEPAGSAPAAPTTDVLTAAAI